MIVDPDFCDHWKTRMLVGSLGNDEAAPVYVLRIWAHCQNRRQWHFTDLSTEALKALCRFPGQSNKLESSLAASGFVRRVGKTLTVLNWDEYNSSLIAAWQNGKLGGRPKSDTKQTSGPDPPKTQASKPKTHGITPGFAIGGDGNGLDEIRVDGIGCFTGTDPPTAEPSTGPPSINVEAEFILHWNTRTGCAQIKAMSPKRRAALKTRLSEPDWDWRAAVNKFPLKTFQDNEEWQPNVDWFLRPDTVLKILEGTYDRVIRRQQSLIPMNADNPEFFSGIQRSAAKGDPDE